MSDDGEKVFDEDLHMRLKDYRTLGWTKKALDDESWYIRREAYRALGWTKKALKDSDLDIRKEAAQHFKDEKSIDGFNKRSNYE